MFFRSKTKLISKSLPKPTQKKIDKHLTAIKRTERFISHSNPHHHGKRKGIW